MKPQKYWKSQVPVASGWYWIKYWGKRGQIICPAGIVHFTDDFVVRTARNDSFTSHNVKHFGKFYFGASIEMPSDSAKRIKQLKHKLALTLIQDKKGEWWVKMASGCKAPATTAEVRMWKALTEQKV